MSYIKCTPDCAEFYADQISMQFVYSCQTNKKDILEKLITMRKKQTPIFAVFAHRGYMRLN